MANDLNNDKNKFDINTLSDKEKRFLAMRLKTGKMYYWGLAIVFLSFMLSVISANYIHAIIIANFLYWGVVICYLEKRFIKILMNFITRTDLENISDFKKGTFGTLFRWSILAIIIFMLFYIIPIFLLTNTGSESFRKTLFPKTSGMDEIASQASRIEYSFNESYPGIEIQTGMKRNEVNEKMEFAELTTEIHGYAFDLERKGWGSIFIGYDNQKVVRSIVNTGKTRGGYATIFANEFSEEHLDNIEKGMSMDEIVPILGEPLRKTLIFRDNNNGKSITLTFDNDLLTLIEICNLWTNSDDNQLAVVPGQEVDQNAVQNNIPQNQQHNQQQGVGIPVVLPAVFDENRQQQ